MSSPRDAALVIRIQANRSLVKQLLTPKQVARAIGVSESSLKRWCDRGLIPVVLTAGGHRRLPISGVLAFVRDTGRPLVQPDLLGLPVMAGRGQTVMQRAVELLTLALINGDENQTRQILFDAYLAGQSVAEICDRVVAKAFRRIGEQWECGAIEVYRERRSCCLCMRVLFEIRSVLPPPNPQAPIAIGGAIAGDHYDLPTAMVELVLRSLGWNATSLGPNLPLVTLAAAVCEVRPSLLWLSATHMAAPEQFMVEYRSFQEALAPALPLVVGGQAFSEQIRRELSYSAFCDNMRHLVSFMATLAPQ
jgi:methanogenic corrinoid protein MtbC1